MENFQELSNSDKKDILMEYSGKQVSMVYDYSDLPNGRIGPQKITGQLVSVGITKFSFCFADTSDTAQLTIDGIVELQ